MLKGFANIRQFDEKNAVAKEDSTKRTVWKLQKFTLMFFGKNFVKTTFFLKLGIKY